jgi:hypothetical protein
MKKQLKNKIIWVILIPLLILILGGLILEYLSPKNSLPSSITNSPDSINTINQQGGNNVIINNNSPKPFLLEKKLDSINMPTSKGYETNFLLTVGFPPDSNLSIHLEYPSNTLSVNGPTIVKSGTRTYSTKVIPYTAYLISFVNKEKIQETDFNFFINI